MNHACAGFQLDFLTGRLWVISSPNNINFGHSTLYFGKSLYSLCITAQSLKLIYNNNHCNNKNDKGTKKVCFFYTLSRHFAIEVFQNLIMCVYIPQKLIIKTGCFILATYKNNTFSWLIEKKKNGLKHKTNKQKTPPRRHIHGNSSLFLKRWVQLLKCW